MSQGTTIPLSLPSCSAFSSVFQQRPELMQLCSQRKWLALIRRCETHAAEAIPSDLCYRGEGTSVLAQAVRLCAPLSVVHTLVQANFHQIGLVNRLRGTVLHDYLKYNLLSQQQQEDGQVHQLDAGHDVFRYLLHKMIEYQENMEERDDRVYCNKRQHTPVVREVSVQTGKPVGSGPTDLLDARDDLDRTVLHCLVNQYLEALTRPTASPRVTPDSLLDYMKELLVAYPQIVCATDTDNKTTLLYLLQHISPSDTQDQDSSRPVEHGIFLAVELLLSVDATIAMIPDCPPWRCYSTPPVSMGRRVRGMPRPRRLNNTGSEPATMSPLCCAVLYGRSQETIQLLMKTVQHATQSSHAESMIPNSQEHLLHVAVSTRSSVNVIQCLIDYDPESLLCRDKFGLHCVDWLWIRYVIDSFMDPALYQRPTYIISRRRFIPRGYLEWHETAISASNIQYHLQQSLAHQSLDQLHQAELLEKCYKRMESLLPRAAAQLAGDNTMSANWGLAHSLSFFPCSIGLLRVALAMNKRLQQEFSEKDERQGRYPLHYAAENVAPHEIRVPEGNIISHMPVFKSLRESSTVLNEVLALFPPAAQSRDKNGQLALHISIDSGKKYRQSRINAASYCCASSDGMSSVVELNALNFLLTEYPNGLFVPDGKTMLLPWLQAAVGEGVSLDVIYMLLRREPSLISREGYHSSSA